MTHVVQVSREDLERRRSELLRSIGTTLPRLAERARSGDLHDDEWPVWTEICEIQFLLREELPGASAAT